MRVSSLSYFIRSLISHLEIKSENYLSHNSTYLTYYQQLKANCQSTLDSGTAFFRDWSFLRPLKSAFHLLSFCKFNVGGGWVSMHILRLLPFLMHPMLYLCWIYVNCGTSLDVLVHIAQGKRQCIQSVGHARSQSAVFHPRTKLHSLSWTREMYPHIHTYVRTYMYMHYKRRRASQSCSTYSQPVSQSSSLVIHPKLSVSKSLGINYHHVFATLLFCKIYSYTHTDRRNMLCSENWW